MALDTSVEEQELKAKKAKRELSSAELMVHASRKSGRSAFKLGREFMRLQKGRGKLTLVEYVRYALYDNERYTDADKDRFIGEALHWPITSETSDRTWDAATEDKWMANLILDHGGYRVPETVAVIDRSGRNYGRTPCLTDAGALAGFLANAPLPLFGKVLRGVASLGAFIVEGADATHIHLTGRAPIAHEAFLAEFVGDNAYVLQSLVKNHPEMDRFTGHTATVRMVTMVRGNDVFVPFAVLKLPGADNIADAFWRPGNIACNLDPQTGAILRVTTQDGIDIVEHEAHPESGVPMLGEVLPLWDEMRRVTKEAALMFAPVRYQSLDVAITADGPSIIEINTGGGWDLPQNASGEGFLTDEVVETFKEMGCTLI
jgi:hypothetical protein